MSNSKELLIYAWRDVDVESLARQLAKIEDVNVYWRNPETEDLADKTLGNTTPDSWPVCEGHGDEINFDFDARRCGIAAEYDFAGLCKSDQQVVDVLKKHYAHSISLSRHIETAGFALAVGLLIGLGLVIYYF